MTSTSRTVDLTVERHLLTGMIVSDRFLQDIQTIYNAKLVESKYVRTVAKWCLDYWARYAKAPGSHIRDMYDSYSRKGVVNEDESDLIGKFLESLSDEYENADKLNTQYLLDQCKLHFKARSLQILAEDIQTHLTNGDVMEAETTYANYSRVELPQINGTNPLTDKDLIYRAFEEYTEPLFTFPGAVGEMINSQLVRENFIAYMGCEKIGKSWTLVDTAIRSLSARCNTAFFSCGDMSETQVTRRIGIRLAGKSDQLKYCRNVVEPYLDCQFSRDGSCHRGDCNREGHAPLVNDSMEPYDIAKATKESYKPCTVCLGTEHIKPVVGYRLRNFDRPLGWRDAVKVGEQFMKRLRNKGKSFKLYSCPTKTLTVQMLKNQLDMWEQFEGFVPDVIVIDYADIMKEDAEKKDRRHQEDDRWAGLRGLAQERHCLIITATQANAESYTKETLGMSNFSESKTKLAHVTGLIGLNRTQVEKKKKIMRWNWIVLREDDFDIMSTVTILQSISTGRPCVDSFK